MYSLLSIGPLRISTYGVSLLVATYLWWSWTERRAAGRLPEWFLPCVIGAAWLGGRLGAILIPSTSVDDVVTQLLTIRILEYSWWSAGATALFVWLSVAKRQSFSFPQSFTDAIIPLFVAYGIVTAGGTIGGVTVGTPTTVPWAMDVYGQLRHPVGIYQTCIVWVGALWLLQRERTGLPIGWAGVLVYAVCMLITGGFTENGIVMAGGLHVVQVGALCALFISYQRVMMHGQKHN